MSRRPWLTMILNSMGAFGTVPRPSGGMDFGLWAAHVFVRLY